jgi:phenylalanyl-tRNA synthetase beta chain
VTYALVAPEDPSRFGRATTVTWRASPSSGRRGSSTVTNPLSSQHSVLRQSLLGSLLEVVGMNRRHGRDDVAVFEIGKGYGRRAAAGTREWWRLGFALAGSALDPSWNQPARALRPRRRQGACRADLRRSASRQPSPTTAPDDPNLTPAAPARVGRRPRGNLVAGRPASSIPRSSADLDLDGPIVVAELAIAGLARWHRRRPWRTRRATSAVERDLAVVVSEDRPAADVAAIRASWRRPAEAVDAVRRLSRPAARGDRQEPAWRLRFQAPDRTLTEAEIDAARRARSSAGLGRLTSEARIRADGTLDPVAALDWPLLPLRGFGPVTPAFL